MRSPYLYIFSQEGAEPQAASEVENRLEQYFTEIDTQHPITPERETHTGIQP